MAVTFESFKFARSLQDKADLTLELAEGIAEAFSDAATDQLTTKSDLIALTADIGAKIADIKAEIKAELRILKWVSALTLALLVVALAKLFVH